EALNLGFEACGVAPASTLPAEHTQYYKRWIDQHFNGEMDYLVRHTEKRMNPALLVPGAKSVISVALGYFHSLTAQETSLGIARYAHYPDYHPLIRGKLHELLKRINEAGANASGRAFADSAPLFERYWAQEAGLGWIGKNRQLIVTGKGSWFLLGELVIDIQLDYDKSATAHCGLCRRCIDACPGKALDENNGLDARRCLSYLTIEKKGAFSPEEAALCGENTCLFGCDKCQEVCPWNRKSQEQKRPEMPLLPEILQLNPLELKTMTEPDFSKHFENSSLQRTGLYGLQRNLAAIKKPIS
ncbi:MAG: tRNA epoxyqueuosine(34) reductase QueG, partial [Bacteroidota bacterium]|nr:tRNA epoxyqueuosine(34) reductase QueG [Bacteroidota bacterium]